MIQIVQEHESKSNSLRDAALLSGFAFSTPIQEGQPTRHVQLAILSIVEPIIPLMFEQSASAIPVPPGYISYR
jgi:hypothetical protein